jgi:predicted amidohydrolase YtcJ
MRLRLAGPSLLFGLVACSSGPKADLVVYGRTWTGDSAKPWAQAVAVTGDTISLVGDSAGVAAMVGPKTTVIAEPTGMVVPGLNDSHTHFLSSGFRLASVNLREARSPEEFIKTLADYARTVKPGTWILGGGWDHERWPGAPLPDRAWIDSVTPNNPVFVNRLDGHMGVANTKALELAKLIGNREEIAGGEIVRDPKGVPTGVLKDAAMGPMRTVIPTPDAEQSDSALARAMKWANARGVTAVGAVSAPWYEVAAWKRAKARGAQTVRVSLYPSLEDWHAVADTMAKDGKGDDWIRVAGVKGYVDGSLGSTTALFYEPYLDAPDKTGLLVTPEASLRSWIGAADSAGLQVAVHAIGERANGLVLDIFDSVAAAHGARDRRFRIEHAQHLRAQDIERIGKTGVIASMQPYHMADDGNWAWKRIRPDQIARTYAFRSLLDARAHLALGSDWPVAPTEPLFGIWDAVTRRTLDGKNPEGWTPAQKITVEEALRSYTAEGAYASFAEQRRGVLKPGMLADLTVIGGDLTRVAPPTIQDVPVRATVVGGKVVFHAGK